ncbi:MAG: toll/interleukin-1 receptor domain-containing protein, partial [Mycobacteriaceae bacterium]
MPGFSSRGIFLSYRREDAAPYARLLQFQLGARIPDTHVFVDLDSIKPGLDFAEVIQEAIESCSVLVALIGRQWATLADEEGHPRLENSDDYVRFELRTALEHGVRVIPVLVDGARPLQKQQLPSELQKLARLNALELSYSRYQHDADRLLDVIQGVLAAAADSGTVDQLSSTADADVPIIARPPGVRPGENGPDEAAQKEPVPVRDDRARTARLLVDAERIAQALTDADDKARALVAVAKALAATNPDRAAQLFGDAERIARWITDRDDQAYALSDLADALAATDPDRAERIAQSVTGKNRNAMALGYLAQALAATDPDRAERIAQSIVKKDKKEKVKVLADVAKALAATDRVRAAQLFGDAERIARSITDKYDKASALAAVAEALAATDPDRAERIAQSIAGGKLDNAMELADVAEALAATDPDRAERLAQSITIARPNTDGLHKVEALAATAKALAATDPDRADRLITTAEHIAQSITHEGLQGGALADVADALAATDPDRAERTAWSITDDKRRARALAAVAKALAATDPDR